MTIVSVFFFSNISNNEGIVSAKMGFEELESLNVINFGTINSLNKNYKNNFNKLIYGI